MKKILISGLVGIGDYILLRCFIKSMRESLRYKNIKLTLLGNAIYKDFSLKYDTKLYDNFIWVDCEKVVPYSTSFIERICHARKRNLLKKALSEAIELEKFDEIIMPDWWSASTKLRVLPLIAQSTHSHKIVYALRFEEYKKSLSFFNEIIRDEIDYSKHVLQMNQCFFMQLCGNADIDFDLTQLKKNKSSANFFDKQIAISLSATDQFRKWSPINYAKVIANLHETFSCQFYLLGGTNEINESNEIIATIGNQIKIENKVGKASLSETTKIIAHSDLLISNDTGLYHIGIMSGTESICISNANGVHAFVPYPKTITNKCHLIVPYILEDKIGTKAYSQEKQWNLSTTDINLVNPNRVIMMAEKILDALA